MFTKYTFYVGNNRINLTVVGYLHRFGDEGQIVKIVENDAGNIAKIVVYDKLP